MNSKYNIKEIHQRNQRLAEEAYAYKKKMEMLAQEESTLTKNNNLLTQEINRIEKEIARTKNEGEISTSRKAVEINVIQQEIEQLKAEILQKLTNPSDVSSDLMSIAPPLPSEISAELIVSPHTPQKVLPPRKIAPQPLIITEEQRKQDEAEASKEIDKEIAEEIAAEKIATSRKKGNDDPDNGWEEEDVLPPKLSRQERIDARLKEKQEIREREHADQELKIERQQNIARQESSIASKNALFITLKDKFNNLTSDLAIRSGSNTIYEAMIKSQNELIKELKIKKDLLIAKKDTIVKKIDTELEAQQHNAHTNEQTSSIKASVKTDNEQAIISEVPVAPVAPVAPVSTNVTNAQPKPSLSSTKTPEVNQNRSSKNVNEGIQEILSRRNRIEDDSDDDEIISEPTESYKKATMIKQGDRKQEQLSKLGIFAKAADPQALEKAKKGVLQVQASALESIEKTRLAIQNIDAFLAEADNQVIDVIDNIRKNAEEAREAESLKAVVEVSQQAADTAQQKAKGDAIARVQETAVQEALLAAAEKVDTVVDNIQKTTTVTAKTQPEPVRVRNLEMEAEIRQKIDEQRSREVERRKANERKKITTKWAEKREDRAKVREEARSEEARIIEKQARQELLDKANFDKRLQQIEIKMMNFDLKSLNTKDEKTVTKYSEAAENVLIVYKMLVAYRNDFLNGNGNREKDLDNFIENCEQNLNSEATKRLTNHRGFGRTIKDLIYSIAQALRNVLTSNKSETKTYEKAVFGSTNTLQRIIDMKNALVDLKNDNVTDVEKGDTRKP